MLKTLFTALFLLILNATAFAEEVDTRMPVHMECRARSNHVQEVRYCKTVEQALGRLEKTTIRPSTTEDEALVSLIILTQYEEKQEALGISTTVIFVSPYFGGVYPWLVSKIDELPVRNWQKDVDEILLDTFAAVADNLKVITNALEMIKCNCREPHEFEAQLQGGENAGTESEEAKRG